MENTKMSAPGALHLFPSAPSPGPVPLDVSAYKYVDDVSKKFILTAQGAAGPIYDEMQMEIGLAESPVKASNQPPSPLTTDIIMQMNGEPDDDIPATKSHGLVVEELQTFPSSTDSTSDYTTTPGAKGATLEATESARHASLKPVLSDAEVSDGAASNANITLKNLEITTTPSSIESKIAEPATVLDQGEDTTAHATAKLSDIEKIPTHVNAQPKAAEPASIEPATTGIATSEPEGSPKDDALNDSTAEDIHLYDTFDHGNHVPKLTSPPEDAAKLAALVPETDQPESMDIEVQKLQAAYDSSCDGASQISEKERDRENGGKHSTTTSAQEGNTLAVVVDGRDMATESVENSYVGPSSVRTTTERHLETASPNSVRPSMFGGPEGALNTIITPVDDSELDRVSKVKPTSRIESSLRFDLTAETKSTSVFEMSAEIAEFMTGFSDPSGPPVLSDVNMAPSEHEFEWATEFDAESGVGPDTEAATEIHHLDTPPQTDGDAKPDMNDFLSDKSQTPRNKAFMELIDNRFEDVPPPQDGDATEEADNVPDQFKKRPECICGACRNCKWNLRQLKDDGYQPYQTHVPDTDKTGDFEPSSRKSPVRKAKQHKSKEKIVDVGLGEGEEDEDDKGSYEDESSAEDDVSNTKGRKRARARASKSSGPFKRVKNNAERDNCNDGNEQDAPLTKSCIGTQTIVQMLQRLAKTVKTRLSYPMIFNSDINNCNICSTFNFAILGFGIRKIKIYNCGKVEGIQELPDTDAAGFPVFTKQKVAATTLCMGCTTARMHIIMCRKHALAPLDPLPTMDLTAALSRLIHNQPPSEDEIWCSICPAVATFTCCADTITGNKGCGLKVCQTCAAKLSATHDGDLGTMLKYLKDEVTDEYKGGLRADVELLRKDGELLRYMIRESKKEDKGKAAA